jgi:hypothetical protein
LIHGLFRSLRLCAENLFSYLRTFPKRTQGFEFREFFTAGSGFVSDFFAMRRMCAGNPTSSIGIAEAKLDASVALAASGALPENVNYAVKSSLLLSFLESVPAVSAKLKVSVTADRKFEDVVKSAQDAAVLVLVY